MNRRQFLRNTALAVPATLLLGTNALSDDTAPIRIAITIDDPHT